MKALLIALVSLASPLAMAGASNSLPQELRDRALSAIATRCAVSSANTLEITAVTVREKQVDQGIIDYFYTISVEALRANGTSDGVMIVEAADYMINNPSVDRYEIISVSGGGCQ